MTTSDDDNRIATMDSDVSESMEAKAGTQIWIDGRFVDRSQATISVFDHGLLYGDGCFEGIRIYDGRIFMLSSHLDRLYESARRIRLQPFYDQQALESATREVVERSGLRNGYIRIVLTRGVGSLGLHPFKCERSSAIIIADAISLYPESMYSEGMAIIVAKRPRIPVACLDPQIKSLNYLNNILAKVEAIDAGVLEAIMLNIDGDVAECTGDNIFVVKDGAISTPDLSAGMLNGITRAYVINEVAPARGHTVIERRHVIEELMQADEIFLTGTAAEIIGVSSIDGVLIGSGGVGPVTKSLIDEFRGRVHADAPEH
jgi:branched-chain amino acid aminotransferase